MLVIKVFKHVQVLFWETTSESRAYAFRGK